MGTELATGFADPVLGAQSTFRAVMNAMARPGSLHAIGSELTPPTGLCPAAAAIVLTLFDHDTPVWLDSGLRGSEPVRRWLSFHAGCPLTDDPGRAAFALIGNGHALPALEAFAPGTPDYPDRATTLVLAVDSLEGGPSLRLSGPGIAGTSQLRIAGLPADFVEQWTDNRALFPCGVDLIFVAGNRIAALPRTTNVVTD